MMPRIDRMLSNSLSRLRNRRTVLGAMAAVVPLAVAGNHAPAGAQDDAAAATPCPPTTPEAATVLAEAYFAAFNAGDADALADLLADDYTHHGAVVSQQDKEAHKERLLTRGCYGF